MHSVKFLLKVISASEIFLWEKDSVGFWQGSILDQQYIGQALKALG